VERYFFRRLYSFSELAPCGRNGVKSLFLTLPPLPFILSQKEKRNQVLTVCCRNNLCLPECCFSRCSAARGIPTICPVVTQVANSALHQTCDLPLKGTFQRAKVGFPTVLEVAHRVRFPAQKSRKALPAVMAIKEVFAQQAVEI